MSVSIFALDMVHTARAGRQGQASAVPPCWQALRRFAEALVRQRGQVDGSSLARFVSAGFTRQRKARHFIPIAVLVGAASLAAPGPLMAQSPAPAYGEPVGLERARDILAKARAEAQRNNWTMAIAIVDPGGHLVALERMDQTQTFSIQIAIDKARTAGGLRRSTKVLEDAVGAGRNAILSLAGVTAIEGGLPIVVGGLVVGAIGVSGATSAQDGQVAAAGLSAR
jgi:glc operon protein GlcG